jgi:hypothetical protein
MPAIDPSRLLLTVNPKLAAEWHPKKNTVLSLETVYAGSSKKAWWQCSTCGYEWEAGVGSRNGGRGCSNCAGKIPNETNSLISLHPEIAAQYSQRNTQAVETLTRISHKKVWWQCSDNPDHEWEAIVFNRVRQGDGCPYCSGRYATKENNLGVKYPELVAEFDLEKNYPLTPYTVTPSSPKRFWWKCIKGHEWQSSRVRLDVMQNCPYCVGKKATHDNNLSVTHPEVAKQYHPSKNVISVEKIRYGSRTRRWWICDEGHEWEATVSSRSRKERPSGCPECSPTPRTSKIEIDIREALVTASVLSDVPKTYNAFIVTLSNKRLQVDVLGTFHNGKQVVIEYDSWWWHSGKGRNESYSIPQTRDTLKTLELLDSGYIVIRIREARPDVSLPLLPIQHENLAQIKWDQLEGIPTLIAKIQSDLK